MPRGRQREEGEDPWRASDKDLSGDTHTHELCCDIPVTSSSRHVTSHVVAPWWVVAPRRGYLVVAGVLWVAHRLDGGAFGKWKQRW
jgi:hypothetical protein